MPAAPAAPPPAPPAQKPSAPPPAKPAAPQPAKPTKPEPPARSQETAFDDAFADLDRVEAKSTDKAIAPVKPKKEEPPKPKEEEKVTPEDDDDYIPEEKPKEKEPADEKPKAEDKVVGPKDLRSQYEKSKATLKEKDAEISRLKAEIESKGKTVPEVDPAIKAELESTKKRLAEYEDEIRFTNYQKHPEFIEKYQKPYHDAFSRALGEFEQLNVSDEEGKSRKATREDLDALLRMSVSEVDRVANESFGPSAARVIRHVEKLRDLGDAYHTAISEAKTKSAEREKTKAAEIKAAQEQRDNWWKQANDEAPKKYPHWFGEKEGDKEVNEALQKGYTFADSAFNPEQGITPEQLTKRHAALRNKAAGFHRLVVELKRANARIAELEKAQAELEESEPPAGEGSGVGGKVINGRWEDNAFAELDEIDKKSRR